MSSWQRDALNLNLDILGQGLDGNAAAGRLVREVLCVLLVHVLHSPANHVSHHGSLFAQDSHSDSAHRKISHVGEEDVDLDDLFE